MTPRAEDLIQVLPVRERFGVCLDCYGLGGEIVGPVEARIAHHKDGNPRYHKEADDPAGHDSQPFQDIFHIIYLLYVCYEYSISLPSPPS